MSMIQIFGATFSSYVWVVRMVCEEKQIPYDLVPAGLRSQEICAIHPFGKMPAATGYLAGGGFSLADINLLPVLHYAQQCPEGIDMVRSAKSLCDYFARHSQRPSFQSTMPQPHTVEETAAVRKHAAAKITEQSARVRLQNVR
jgi:glutathione S-transferase